MFELLKRDLPQRAHPPLRKLLGSFREHFAEGAPATHLTVFDVLYARLPAS
ncbi:hypothetical protein DICSQDRAFT_176187 [Dichomitus squalens LYAD-421 SS1]|uniref:Uncharacterized protein n=1 Tax=Dichomitus squalens (strain LYAD-421) TaxID=732165 RepID=R7SHR1_DICSQ|nr:uncharacterized protein DICSQDRAFT_176187 [Dichomitus squalens LYAD-421 SS1]EJF55260.1 hypothetical protein DICSQDRAFT_176187 [Dichomitus squalens LYAD-421 SS1]